MTSQIDITKPIFGTPTTQSVRDNFTTAHNEITTLQGQVAGSPFLPLAGARMTGVMYLFNDPTDAMMPATKGYVDANAGVGGGGIPEAPADSFYYGRYNGAWAAVLGLAGGTLTGPLILAADPTNPLGACSKQYADAIAAAHLTDAPNNTNTYGRKGAAWVGVLPIVGGQISGSVSIGTVAIPGDVSVPTLFSNAQTFALNAGVSWNVYGATGANPFKYLAAGYAGGVGVTPAGDMAFSVYASGAAGGALTGGVSFLFNYKGNMTLPNAAIVPTDSFKPGWLSANEFVTIGHYCFNSYIPAPGTAWKFLQAGYCAQFWQDAATGNVTLNISSASGAAGGAVGSVCSVLWDKSGNYYLDGNINGGQGIMARASGGNAFVGSYQTAGTMANVGFWNYNNTLYFGNADGNGAPSASRGYIDPSSNLYMTGALYGGAGLFVGALGSQFGVYSNPADRIMQMATGWYWDWQISSGTLMWYSPSGPLLNMRLAPDNLAWNAIGPMGGNGAYVNISDERAKTDVALATVGLAEVLKLEPINFTRIAHQPPADAMMEDGSPVPTGSHPPEIGFSAQQVRPIIPEAVRVIGSPLPDGSGTLDTDTPTLATTDTAILAAVVNAIKNIDARLVAKGI